MPCFNRNLNKIWLCSLLISGYTSYAQTTKTLQTVTITAPKPLVEKKADRTIVHVDALLSATGSNGMEVLDLAPGVQTGNDQITLQGKPNVTILLNGKPVYLSGAELADYLRALPGASIASIEILPYPPSGYDAAGNGGIINIILKKEHKKGFNGTLLSENIRGRCSRITQNAHFNYRNNNVNLYTMLDNYNSNGYSKIERNRTYPASDLQHSQQQSVSLSQLHRFLGKAGLEWFPSSKTTLHTGIQYIYRDLAIQNNGSSTEQYTATDSVIQTDHHRQYYYNNTNIYAQLRHAYDSNGREMAVDADYIRYTRGLKWRETEQLHSYQQILTGDQPVSTTIFTFKADYTLPLGKSRKLAIGYKAGFAHTQAGAFDYRENIQAAYAHYNRQIRSFSYQVGLRAEYTHTFSDYLNLFPSASCSYKLSVHQIGVSYSRRIDRPEYFQLNPALLLIDRYTYELGNPYLQPQLSDNMELSYNYKNEFSVSGFYTQVRNNMEETVQVKDGNFYQRMDNIGRKKLTGINISGSLALTRWWNVLPYLQYTHRVTHALLPDTGIYLQNDHWSLTLTQQFNFPRGWGAEIFGSYTTAEAFTQYTQQGGWYIHTGAGKKICGDRGIIKLNIRDVFHSRVDAQQFYHLNGVTDYQHRTWDTQSVTLAFSWRFSKGQKTGKGVSAGSNEESRRLGEL